MAVGSSVLGNDLDQADDVTVEIIEAFGRNPVLNDGLTADLLHVVLVEVRLLDVEPRDIANATSLNVPVPRDLGCVVLVEYRIEDRLTRQPRRPRAPAGRLHQRQF